MSCYAKCEGCLGMIDVYTLAQAKKAGVSEKRFKAMIAMNLSPAACGLAGVAGREAEAAACNSGIDTMQWKAAVALSNDEDLTDSGHP